ncbi:MAG: DUF424 family protein [Thaumarchaeota archaeon]|nr:DUF424 family protein [Candidatus Calditenuaceae archaeon]MDW8187677.1 DUF424 family protein [Nitrososphaerota archaeon]
MGGHRFWAKLHHAYTGEIVLAACDEDILGRSIAIEDGFEAVISEGFYMGSLVDWEQLKSMLSNATIVNLVGNEVIDLAVREGIVPEAAFRTIGGVKHVQIMR